MNMFLFLLSPDANVAFVIAVVVGLIGLYCIFLLRGKILTLNKTISELKANPAEKADHSGCGRSANDQVEAAIFETLEILAREFLQFLAINAGLILGDNQAPEYDSFDNDTYIRLIDEPQEGQVYVVGIKLSYDAEAGTDDISMYYYKAICHSEAEDEEVEITLAELNEELARFAASVEKPAE